MNTLQTATAAQEVPHFYSPSVQRQSCQNILSCTRPAQRRVHSLHDKVHIRIAEFIWVVKLRSILHVVVLVPNH